MSEDVTNASALFDSPAERGPAVPPTDAPRANINLQHLSAASLFASKEETRYYLNGVYVEIERRSCVCVATDGHRLIAIRHDNLLSDPDNTLIGGFIVPTPQCKAFKFPKDGPFEGVISGTGKRLTLSYDRIDVSFNPIDGQFPDWRRVIPARVEKLAAAHFDYKLLADFKKFADTLDFGHPSLAPDGVEKPALVWFPNHYEAFGVMMPLRNQDESGRGVPEWASAAARPGFTPPHDEDGVILQPEIDDDELTADLSGTEVDVSGLSPGMREQLAKRARAAGARVTGDA